VFGKMTGSTGSIISNIITGLSIISSNSAPLPIYNMVGSINVTTSNAKTSISSINGYAVVSSIEGQINDFRMGFNIDPTQHVNMTEYNYGVRIGTDIYGIGLTTVNAEQTMIVTQTIDVVNGRTDGIVVKVDGPFIHSATKYEYVVYVTNTNPTITTALPVRVYEYGTFNASSVSASPLISDIMYSPYTFQTSYAASTANDFQIGFALDTSKFPFQFGIQVNSNSNIYGVECIDANTVTTSIAGTTVVSTTGPIITTWTIDNITITLTAPVTLPAPVTITQVYSISVTGMSNASTNTFVSITDINDNVTNVFVSDIILAPLSSLFYTMGSSILSTDTNDVHITNIGNGEIVSTSMISANGVYAIRFKVNATPNATIEFGIKYDGDSTNTIYGIQYDRPNNTTTIIN
jgi:hypothetical protein